MIPLDGTPEKLVLLAVSVGLLTASAVQSGPPAVEVARPPHPSSGFFSRLDLFATYKPYGLVAHALGSVNDVIYSNTLEAFQSSNRKGFRLFEADLTLLKDGTVLAAHPGVTACYGLTTPLSDVSWEDLKHTRYEGKYTTLTSMELLELLERFTDIYLITDTKDHHLAIHERLVDQGRQNNSSVLGRIIPHIGGESELLALRRLYPFTDFMVAVYRSSMTDRELLDLVDKHGLRGVMMPWNSKRAALVIPRLQRIGVTCYVHSLDDPLLIDAFRSLGIGVYSDGYFPPSDSTGPVAQLPPGWQTPADKLGYEKWADPALGTLPGLITVSPSMLKGQGKWTLTVKGLSNRQVDIRFQFEGQDARVFTAFLNNQGQARYHVLCGTRKGRYRFGAVRLPSGAWLQSDPSAELLIR